MSKRTVRDFKAGVDLLPTVDNWAKDMGYALKESSSTKRLYQKSSSTQQMRLELSQTGTDVHLEAWVHMAISHAQTGPLDVGLESGSFIGFIPRNYARTDVNKLLTRINQPLIQ